MIGVCIVGAVALALAVVAAEVITSPGVLGYEARGGELVCRNCAVEGEPVRRDLDDDDVRDLAETEHGFDDRLTRCDRCGERLD